MKSRNIDVCTIILTFLSVCFFNANAHAQGGVDANTLLLLRFENSPNGEQGETPTTNTGITYEAGILGQGVLIDSSDILRYATSGNFNASAGTIEFWVKPRWNGNEAVNRCLFGAGNSIYTNGNLVFEKDGGGFLGATVNAPHAATGTNVSSWAANQWHYVAYTWEFPGNVKVYVDGTERFSRPAVAQDVISPLPSALTVGSIGSSWQANAVLDELRVSDRPRTTQEIVQRMLPALTVNSLSLSAVTTNLWKTWKIPPTITANTNFGTFSLPASAATWSSSNPSTATVNADGQIVGIEAGTTVLTASINGTQANLTINVRAPVLPPRVNVVSNYLKTPAAGSLYEIPVVMIRYLPTSDGINLDTAFVPDFGSLNPISLAVLEARLDDFDRNVKFSLEEGTRFRAYGNHTPTPSLGYRVVASITVYEPTPPGKQLGTSQGLPIYGPEQIQIFERLNIQNYVNNLGVKEIWFWQGGVDASFPSYNPAIHLPENFRMMSESNMSSPTTGDISNSPRDNSDLPLYNKTYVVYGQNIRRSQAEAVHNHGHQLETILSHVNQLQTGNTEMFWQRFVGRAANGAWQRGRAGDTHHPPHVLNDYEYENFTPFASDIADWKPEGGGQTTAFSASTYSNIPYAFPVTPAAQRIESQWYIYWMQSMPGRGNTIPFGANRMTNWWQFTADWDAATRAGVGLYEPASCAFVLSSNSFNAPASGGAGNVSVTTSNSCRWFATSNAAWTVITSGDTSNNGNTTVNFLVSPNNTSNPRTTAIIIGGQVFNVTQSAISNTVFDFDGDRKTDLSIFRPSVGEWWYLRSIDGGNYAAQFGASSDKLVPGDYTGDGKTDIAVWRPASGEWFILRSENGSYYSYPFGTSGDISAVGDFDGDGKADSAVFRPSDTNWYIRRSSDGGFTIRQFGASGDVPAVADYDGDGKSDIAIWRASTGEWWIQKSSDSSVVAFQFGNSLDKPVQGDYTGDGKADVAIWRPSTGEWFILRSEDFSYYSFPFGTNGDIPAPGDYDGDGKFDATVFRPNGSTWYVQRSTAGTLIQNFGQSGDKPVPNAFVP